jgi:hypothetical protein
MSEMTALSHSGARVFEAADVARELDDRGLHAEADPEERHAGLARVANGFDHAFDTAHAEATGHEERVTLAQHFFRARGVGELLARHPLDVDADVVGDTAVDQ